MRIDKKQAFTFVEILIAISIIALVSIVSIGSFSNFSMEQGNNEDFSFINSYIKKIDRQIHGMEIYDYKISFKTGSVAYLTYKNLIHQDYTTILEFDNNTLTGVLTTTGSFLSTGSINSIVGYVDTKKAFEHEIDITDKQNISFTGGKDYEISSSISGSILNAIDLNYYSSSNYDKSINNASKLILNYINTESDKSGNSFSEIYIENINNKKLIKTQSGQILDNVYLIFEKGGKEFSLEIK